MTPASSSPPPSSPSPSRSARKNVFVGVAGWSYDDWYGTFYPERPGRDFDPLRYAAERFDCLEVNSTFYRIPAAKTVERWARAVHPLPRFTFTAKLFRELTHGAPEKAALARLCDEFREALRPLVDAGRLGCVLAQFPWYFEDSAESRGRLEALADSLRGLPIVVEIRHRSFLEGGEGGGLPFLESLGLGFVNIDLPRARTSPPPTSITTSDVGYFRLHGRNAKAWFDPKAGRDDKYHYRYSKSELLALLPLIETIANYTAVTYVVTNNHFRGGAPANALELADLLAERRGREPPDRTRGDFAGSES